MKRLNSTLACRVFGVTATLILIAWLAAPMSSPAANFVVTSLANSGAGTLRAALTTARNGDVNSGNLLLSNCVFAACHASFGGVYYNNGGSGFASGNGGAISSSGTLTAVNCQFLTNGTYTGGHGMAGNLDPHLSPITSGGNGGNGGNGSAGLTNNVLGDIVGTGTPIDPKVGPLADNHGLVPTCALLPGSPALDTGDDTLLGPALNLPTDARGYARKSSAHVDIGAYEHQLPSLPLLGRAIVSAKGVQVTLTNTPGALFAVLATTDLTVPVANWDVLGQTPEVAPGQFQWTNTGSGDYAFRFFRLRTP